MSKINEILDGWANLVKDRFGNLDEDVKKISQERLNTCDSCDIRMGSICNPSKVGLNVQTGKLERGCGCNIAAKTMSPRSRCPLGKWNI